MIDHQIELAKDLHAQFLPLRSSYLQVFPIYY